MLMSPCYKCGYYTSGTSEIRNYWVYECLACKKIRTMYESTYTQLTLGDFLEGWPQYVVCQIAEHPSASM